MDDALVALGGAVDVGAVGVALTRQADQGTAARGARGGEVPGAAVPRPVGHDGAQHLGDHVAGLAHEHGVAWPDVLGLDLVLVVQGGQGDGGAADEYRLEHGEGRRLPGAADRHHDVLEQSRALLGRELVGDRPSRRLRRGPELGALGQVVDLDHHPVYLVREVVSVREPVAAEVVHLLERFQHLDLGVDRETGGAEVPQGLVVGGEARASLDVS